MNIQSIKYLSALAKYSHFGKAAKACFVSQPTLSMQIKKLEDTLEVQLLERTNKSVKLTEMGALMAAHARTILLEMDAMKEKALAAKDPYSGKVKIGIIPTVAPYLLPLLIPQLTQTFPKITYHLLEAQTHSLLEALNLGTLDTAILALPVTDTHLITSAFFTEEFLLATPPGHTLSKKKIVKMADLKDEDLLLLDDGHCLREQALTVCHQARAQEMKEFRATSLETLRHMVAAGVGVTLIPQLASRQSDGVAYIPFANPKPSRTLGLVWRKSSGRSLLFNDLAQQIKKIMQNGAGTSKTQSL